MVLYDWATSMRRESELFISGNARALSAWLYFMNKYLNLVSQLMIIFTFAPLNTQVCPQSLLNERSLAEYTYVRGA